MKRLISNGEADIIIGPTESDVFVMGIENRKELEKDEVPVISSLIISDVPYKVGGWFFRTNVDVRRRVEAIHDYMNKYWIRSIAILYANTAWGRRAQEAFSEELSLDQKNYYMPLMYNPPPASAREQIRQILNVRPDAVGIFGEREDLKI